jgi:2,4-dienoyl-CoA reductase (NADPH2)
VVGPIHVYTAELNGELVLFDTGPDTPEAREYLCTHIDLARLRHVFITHCHVDHYGLADFLGKNTGAVIYLPRKDSIKFRNRDRRTEHIQELLTSYGFADDFIRAVRAAIGRQAVPERYQIVEESNTPQRLGISFVNCPGHSQSDLVYQVGDCAITGDVLLRTIFQTPLLDVNFDSFSGRFRNYEAYCATLIKFQQLCGSRILPGHGEEIDSLAETILFYIGKLLERAGRLKAFSHLGQLSHVVRELFGSSSADPFVTYAKISEIIFMRDFLADPGLLQESLEFLGLFPKVSDTFAAVTT